MWARARTHPSVGFGSSRPTRVFHRTHPSVGLRELATYSRFSPPLRSPGQRRGTTQGWPPYQLPWKLGPNYPEAWTRAWPHPSVGPWSSRPTRVLRMAAPFDRAPRARDLLVFCTFPCTARAAAAGVLRAGPCQPWGSGTPTAPKGASGEAYRARHEPGTVGDTREPGEAKAKEDEDDAAASPAAHRPRPASCSSAPSQVSLMRHRAQRCAVCKACTGKHDAARARLPPRLRGRGQLGARTAAAAVTTAANGAVAGPGAPTARSLREE